MKVLFEASWWVSGPVSNQQVLREIVRHWIDLFPQDEIVLAVRDSDVEAVRSVMPPRVTIHPLRLRPQGVSAILEIPLIARRIRADISITHNFSPLSGKSAVFVHDVLFMTNPEWFTRRERAYFALMPLTARRANVIFSSSAVEGRRIGDRIRLKRPPVPVGLAVSPHLHTITSGAPDMALSANQFALTVGRLNVRKNLEFTCLAAIASGSFTAEFPLVIAGSFQGKSTEISAEVKRAIDDGIIVLSGFVSDEELVWLYRNAKFFLFMTLDEGFGLPPLEALSFGTEVIASDIPVMREVLTNQATFVNPKSQEDLVATMHDAVERIPASAEVRNARSGFVQDNYSWNAVVQKMRSSARRLTGLQP